MKRKWFTIDEWEENGNRIDSKLYSILAKDLKEAKMIATINMTESSNNAIIWDCSKKIIARKMLGKWRSE